MNERIASEIEVMSQEALDFLQKSFERDLNQLYLKLKSDKNGDFESLDQSAQIENLKQKSQDTLISHILLQNIGVNCDQIVAQKVNQISNNISAPVKKERPLIDCILEDITMERMKKQQQQDIQVATPNKVQADQKNVSDFSKSTACDSASPFKGTSMSSAKGLFS